MFFFKQKTAYEMRISDWSSDVCSSDLQRNLEVKRAAGADAEGQQQQHGIDVEGVEPEDPVLRAGAYQQAVRGAAHGDRQKYLCDDEGPDQNRCAHSNISINRRS